LRCSHRPTHWVLRPDAGDYRMAGAGAEIRTRTRLRGEDFKYESKGRRINVYLIRRPFPFTRSTRSALQSEEYGHPGGHLERVMQPVDLLTLDQQVGGSIPSDEKGPVATGSSSPTDPPTRSTVPGLPRGLSCLSGGRVEVRAGLPRPRRSRIRSRQAKAPRRQPASGSTGRR